MKLSELRSIKKLYFGHEEMADALGISPDSARVAASRYVRQGLLVRVKRNLYMRREVWDSAGKEEKFQIANLGQVPSYISLMTALDYYEVTTQVQRDFFESIAVQRTKEMPINGTVFRYTKIKTDLYFGFKKENNFFIALPEKAFLDAFYLMSFGRYSFDLDSIDANRLDNQQMAAISKPFPLRTKNLMQSYGYL